MRQSKKSIDIKVKKNQKEYETMTSTIAKLVKIFNKDGKL
jgi:hypothetical protein